MENRLNYPNRILINLNPEIRDKLKAESKEKTISVTSLCRQIFLEWFKEKSQVQGAQTPQV